MIDFGNSVQKNRTFPERPKAEHSLRGDDSDDEHGYEAPSVADIGRRLIGAKPAMYVTLAFTIGGILGWLTSKK